MRWHLLASLRFNLCGQVFALRLGKREEPSTCCNIENLWLPCQAAVAWLLAGPICINRVVCVYTHVMWVDEVPAMAWGRVVHSHCCGVCLCNLLVSANCSPSSTGSQQDSLQKTQALEARVGFMVRGWRLRPLGQWVCRCQGAPAGFPVGFLEEQWCFQKILQEGYLGQAQRCWDCQEHQ